MRSREGADRGQDEGDESCARTFAVTASPRVPALAGIFAIALALRLGAQIVYGTYVDAETWEYDMIARDLLLGHGYGYRFFGSEWQTFGFPAFPVLLAVLHALGGGIDSYLLIGVALAVASAALVLPAASIGRQLYGRAAGLVAAGLIAVNPVLIFFAARVHEVNLDALLAGTILALVLNQARSPASSGLRLGVLSGIATLARPTVAFFAVASLLALAIRPPRRQIFLALAITAAIALPWTLRNAVVLGSVTPSSPYNCVTLWMGNNGNATGGPLTADGRSVFAAMPDEMRARLTGSPEAEQGRIFCEEAAGFLRGQPLFGVLWWAEKFAYFWWFPPHAGIWYPAGWIDLYRIGWVLEVALALVGAARVLRRGWRLGLALVALQLLMISAAQSVGYVEGRHRLVLEPAISAFAAVGVLTFVGVLVRGPFRGPDEIQKAG